MKIIKQYHYKTNNKRIVIDFLQNDSGEFLFGYRGKRLIDFKTRNIHRTEVLFSVETFTVIFNIMSSIFDDERIIKIIENDFMKLVGRRCSIYENFKQDFK